MPTSNILLVLAGIFVLMAIASAVIRLLKSAEAQEVAAPRSERTAPSRVEPLDTFDTQMQLAEVERRSDDNATAWALIQRQLETYPVGWTQTPGGDTRREQLERRQEELREEGRQLAQRRVALLNDLKTAGEAPWKLNEY